MCRKWETFLCADQDRSIDRCGSFLRVVDVATSLTQRRIPSITYLNNPAYICIKSMSADMCVDRNFCVKTANLKSRNEKFLYTLSINFLECEFSTSTYLSFSLSLSLLFIHSFFLFHIRMLLSWMKKKKATAQQCRRAREREKEVHRPKPDDSIQNNI